MRPDDSSGGKPPPEGGRLKDKDNMYRQLLETLDKVLYAIDPDGVVTYITPAIEKLTGYPPEAVIGSDYADFLPPGERETSKRHFRAVLAGDTVTSEHCYQSPARGAAWVRNTARPLYGKESIIGVQGILVDITERRQAEAAMQKSEERYRHFFENAPVGIFRTHCSGRMVFVNTTMARFLGFKTPEEAVRHYSELGRQLYRHPERRDQLLRRIRARGYVENFEYEAQTRDGRRIWLSMNARMKETDNPDDFHIEGFAIDITQRKQAEQQLNFQSLLLNQIEDCVTATDLEGTITYVNEAEVLRMKRGRAELIGRPVSVYGEDPARGATQREILEKTRKNGEWRGEVVNYAADGTEIVLDTRTRLIKDEKGRALSLVGIATDITERKRSEAERERLMSAIEQIGEIVVITDTGGRIQYVNPAFERVTGYTRKEALGQNPRILKSGVHDTAFYRQLWAAIAGGRTWRGRFINRKKDGTTYTEDAIISPVTDASGLIVSYVAVKRDVTESLQLEEQLHQAQKMESIGRLAGGVAHDLNNLLSPILGYSEMLLEERQFQGGLREPVEEIVNAGRRARSLVRQLLAFSRRQTLQFQPININDLLANFQKLLRRTIREDITLHLEPAPGLPQIKGDIGQLEQEIMNLAVNAQDAMPTGGALSLATASADIDEAYASRKRGVTPGRYVQITISDTGSGMDARTLENLFEPFFTTTAKSFMNKLPIFVRISGCFTCPATPTMPWHATASWTPE